MSFACVDGNDGPGLRSTRGPGLLRCTTSTCIAVIASPARHRHRPSLPHACTPH